MMNSIDYRRLKEKLDAAMDNDKRRFAEVKRKRNVASFIDFASNLLSLAGYSKGARFSLATDLQSRYDSAYAQAKEKYLNSHRDYNGKIAEMTLLDRTGIKKRTPALHSKGIGFMKTISGKNFSISRTLAERYKGNNSKNKEN